MRKLVTMCLCIVLAITQIAAQSRTVKGKVTDDKNTPVSGASVTVKGTTAGTTTGADGSFSLNVPAAGKVLVISSLNFTSQEVAIGTKTNITVSLQSSTQNLQEVVVVGYGTQRKQDVSASVTKVGGDKVANVPFSSVDQILQGKAAGVQSVTFSGQPGANQSVRIRGIGSYSASAQPLYVIDGIQINSGDLSRLGTTSNVLAGLNPDDIESISILKDAAATAVYGSRGGNGVIVITTKKGKAGKTQFNVTGEVGNNTLGDIPAAAKPLNSADWAMLFKESYLNAGGSAANADIALANYGYGTGVDINWKDQVSRSGAQQQFNFSAQGGDAKTTFYVSGGFFKQEASTIGADLKRISTKITLDHQATKKFSFGLNLAPTYTRQNTPVTNGGFFASPVLSIWFLRPLQNPYNADGTLNIGTATKDFSSTYNPLFIAQNDIHSLDRLQLFGDVHAKYDILDNLKFTSKMGIQYDNLEEYQYNNPFHGDGKAANGRGYSYTTRYFLYDWTNQLDYHLNFLNDKSLSFDAKLGYESISSKGYLVSASATNYSTPLLPLSVNASAVTAGTATGSDYSFASVFSTASLSYKGKYVLSGSFRRDGSSRFSANSLYGNFPAGSLAWNISRENFMSKVNFVTDLKIRASYGSSGNAELGNYAWRQLFSYGANYNGLPGGVFNGVGNQDLTWEKTNQKNIGLDFNLLKSKVNVVVDLYWKRSNGLLFSQPVSLTTGFGSITKNVGGMDNNGIELTVNATPVSTRNFSWDISFNFTNNKNKITQLPDGQTQIINGQFLVKPGIDVYSFYMRNWAGVDPATGNPQWYVDDTKSAVTTNYNAAQRVVTGKQADPKYYGGFSNTFRYKAFSIGADLYYNYGNYVQDTWNAYLFDEVNPSYGKYAVNLSRWQKAGDITNVPKLVYGSANFSNSASTRFLYKGDFIRLRNITVSYDAPSNLLKKLNLSSLRFYVRGTNLWTKTYDPNLTVDPEQGVASQSNLNILYNKAVTAGLTIGF